MKFNHIFAVLFIMVILSACSPASADIPPTETSEPTPTFTSLPTSTPTLLPATSTPTFTPTSEPKPLLSEEGPWLVNLVDPSRYACCGGVPEDGEIKLINQDGTGYTTIPLEACDNVSEFLLDGGNEANLLMQFDNGLYLIRPSEGIGMRIYRQMEYGSDCHTSYNGDGDGGLLVSFYQQSEEVSPELILFELPSGDVRQRIPLVECGENNPVCDENRLAWRGMMDQAPLWSPDGRYLAFVALQDTASSDIFIYDTREGEIKRLTNSPEWVSAIGWSPDGTQIIFGEILSYDGGFFSPEPYNSPTKAVRSVSVSTKAIQFLYTPRDWPIPHQIYRWLDDQRFLAYTGDFDPLTGAYDLRYVDTKTGTDRMLFNGTFGSLDYDPIHQTLLLFSQGSEEYQWGLYLISVQNGNLIYPFENTPYAMSYLIWVEDVGLFVSPDPCEEDSQQVYAMDYLGNVQCIPNPTSTNPIYPAPNGDMSFSTEDGLWVEIGNEPAVLVSDETDGEVVWCPDSSCFFFTAGQQDNTWTLHHVSLPDLAITTVAEGIRVLGEFQWLGADN